MSWRDKLRGPPGPGEQPKDRPGYERSEMPVVIDGQVGGENLDRGPERANPEGSVDIANGDYWANEHGIRSRVRRWASSVRKR